jgi:hypothetical protein
MVAETVEPGEDLYETLSRSLPAPFDEWLYGGMWRFEANLRASCHRQSAG